jgi:hypothetical protein
MGQRLGSALSFCFGLSYATFDVKPVWVSGTISEESSPDTNISVNFKITNTGIDKARKSSRFTLRRHWVAPLAVRPRPSSDAQKLICLQGNQHGDRFSLLETVWPSGTKPQIVGLLRKGFTTILLEQFNSEGAS